MTTLNATSAATKHFEAAVPTDAEAQTDTSARVRRADERSFVVLLLLSFPFFLVLAIGARLMSAGNPDGRSVFAVATEAARSTLAIALNL